MEFQVRGMDCAEEIGVLKRELGPLVGGEENLGFDLLRGKLTVSAAGVSSGAIREAVARTGMRADPYLAEEPERRRNLPQTLLAAASGLLAAAGLAVHAGFEGLGAALAGEGVPAAAGALYLAGIACGGWFVAPKAFYALRRLAPDISSSSDSPRSAGPGPWGG